MSKINHYRRWTDGLDARVFHPRRSDWALVQRINRLSDAFASQSDGGILERAAALREKISTTSSVLDSENVVNAFALVKEAARRTLGTPHYDEQLLAGIALVTGAIVQMQTGEGKTLTSSLPAALYGMTGKGVHLATVNAYLAERDFQTLCPIYNSLGISVGYAADGDGVDAKREAYRRDITYATGYELGFDFLRDQVAVRAADRARVGSRVRSGLRGIESNAPVIQRGHCFAIIDEVDSVLLDEATTPLILSAAAESTGDAGSYAWADRLIKELISEKDFLIDSQAHTVQLTESGAKEIYDRMPTAVGALSRPWSMYVEQALRANLLLRRDVDYVVSDDQVMIVDEYTGRIFSERSWRDGLHQAVEAKEGVTISDEKRSIARVSRQRYFQMYDRLCGMTGTATGQEQEFHRFYKSPVVVIPLRKPCRRKNKTTRYFSTQDEKWNAIAEAIAERHANGQPILVGTRTIEGSRRLASLLTHVGIPYRLLNGMQDDDEAALIAASGALGSVTIATNMAGRGTDIKPSDEALKQGGLHVIAAERHDSQRIDRQLMGRAARQGDPGSCQFFVSAEDELIQNNDPKLRRLIEQTAAASGTNEACDDAISRIQLRAEHDKYQRRIQLLNQELWLDNLRSSVA